MTVCPNDKPSFTSMLYKMHLLDPSSTSQKQAAKRRQIYYTICLFTRLIIAGLLLQYRNERLVTYAVLILSLLSIINLYPFSFVPKATFSMWWSSTFQFIIAVLLLLSSLLILIVGDKLGRNATYVYAVLMYVSIVGGFTQSLMNPSCW